jgi:hypothetical protein
VRPFTIIYNTAVLGASMKLIHYQPYLLSLPDKIFSLLLSRTDTLAVCVPINSKYPSSALHNECVSSRSGYAIRVRRRWEGVSNSRIALPIIEWRYVKPVESTVRARYKLANRRVCLALRRWATRNGKRKAVRSVQINYKIPGLGVEQNSVRSSRVQFIITLLGRALSYSLPLTLSLSLSHFRREGPD